MPAPSERADVESDRGKPREFAGALGERIGRRGGVQRLEHARETRHARAERRATSPASRGLMRPIDSTERARSCHSSSRPPSGSGATAHGSVRVDPQSALREAEGSGDARRDPATRVASGSAPWRSSTTTRLPARAR